MFILSAVKYIQNKKRQSYIFLRRKTTLVNELISESMHSEKKKLTKPNVLIPENQELLILTPNLEFRKMKLEDLPEYMEEEEQSRIRLTFEKFVDMKSCMDFVPFIF